MKDRWRAVPQACFAHEQRDHRDCGQMSAAVQGFDLVFPVTFERDDRGSRRTQGKPSD
jgi:hypothetical protein